MNKLVIMRGLPGDGKSTKANAIANDIGKQGKRAIILSTDDIISAKSEWPEDGYLFCLDYHGKAHELNQSKTKEACRRGIDCVIVDNTNTVWRECKPYFDIAKEFNYKVVLEHSNAYWAGQPEECFNKTTHNVPLETIKKMKARFQSDAMIWKSSENRNDNTDEAPVPAYTYSHTKGLPYCIICDLDGTLALFDKEGSGPNSRNPYDCSRCDEIDLVNPAVHFVMDQIEQVNETAYEQTKVILLSGRDSKYRPQTERWLKKYDIWYDGLYMRKEGDTRKDCIVKKELFDANIAGIFNVRLVLDDRDQMVKLWRDMGLPCFQVAYGDF